VVKLNSRGVGMSSLGRWANVVKEDGLTGFGFLTRDGFTRQDSQTGNK